MEQALSEVELKQRSEPLIGVTNSDELSMRQLIDAELLCIGGGSGDVCLG